MQTAKIAATHKSKLAPSDEEDPPIFQKSMAGKKI